MKVYMKFLLKDVEISLKRRRKNNEQIREEEVIKAK